MQSWKTFAVVACWLMAVSSARAVEPTWTPEQIRFFEKDVQPLLQQHCWKCHGGEKIKGGLRLTSRADVLKGGDLGPAVKLDAPLNSNLIKAIHGKDGLEQMPPTGKLPAKDLETLTNWVAAGLPWSAKVVIEKKEPEPKIRSGVVTEEAKKYWAYQPVLKYAPPAVADKAWVKNPIDAFILAPLEAKGLTPAKPANRIALIRRATYDLIGLPPSPEEIDAFLKESEANPQLAYEKLIDRLLASTHYGEKWGRHWLDLVHYAETNGYERDGPKPFAWRFRDYVIRSFNDDKPFDRFLKEQLAGDEIDRENPDCMIATGFYRLGLWDDEPADPKLARYDELDDWVATTGQIFLGMTMNCARCHDHKIDPIPQADYYRMVAFFQDVQRYSNSRDPRSTSNLSDITPKDRRKVYEEQLRQRDVEIADLTKRMTAIEEEAIKKMPGPDQRAAEGAGRPEVLKKVPNFLTEPQRDEHQKLRRQVDGLRREPPAAQELALSINNCSSKPPVTNVLIRGNPVAPGAEVKPAFPSVLGFPVPTIPETGKDAKTAGRRLVLANWIASKDNPLTARTIVNRIWQYHFGRGIVPTPNDFGKFGEKPTHPELLDWLASEFMADDWSFKKMHKKIMLSNTYQMASTANDKNLAADPGNYLFWRFNMRRLQAEEVRDSILAVSGNLNTKMHGPSIYPTIPKEVLAGQSVPGQGWGNSSPKEASRRSVYVYIKRSLLVPILTQFDQADTDSSCPVRYTTTVPTQALGLLNGDFSQEQAAALAERLAKEGDVTKQIQKAIRLTTSRMATNEEVKKDAAFIQLLKDKHKLSDAEAMRKYCLLMLNANEFVYLD